jgi:alkanesulfonate monooxygenase SsuD/methylene tetrahydromethanopterin reductase-like flavin-dependent oxidoreductase (luciferase family)
MGGAGGPITFRHIIEYCDGWMPIHGRRSVFGPIDDLRAASDSAGRDPATLEIGVFGVPGDPAIIDAYRQAGVSRCVLSLPSAPADTIMPLLDQYASLIDT